MDCPNLLYRKGPAATVVMTAHWEIYSSLERKVVAKVTTSGGADFQPKLNDSIMPPVLAAFREHVRQLLASRELRSVVTNTAAGVPGATTQSSQSTIVLLGGSRIARPLSQAMSSVAIIFAADGSGSGFLVSKDGYLLTNRHVVGASRFVKVKWSDGSEVLGEVVRSDARRDIALVKAEAGSRAALALRTAGVELGEAVFAVGTPLGEKQQNTVTKGIVSASRVYDGQPFIQSDVAVTSGNSGGPLLDEKGFVVGLTVFGLAPTGAPIGLNFFIPIDDALRALALRSAG
jgi:S1-C subfamily serine protease